MNYGVYVLKDEDKNNWQSFSNNLTNVNISELEVNYETGVLYASTYGRGIWYTSLDQNNLSNTIYNEMSNNTVISYHKELKILEISSNIELSNVKIYNSLGQLVFKNNKDNRLNNSVGSVFNLKINTFNLKNDVYFVNIEKNGFVFTKKIVIN